MTKTDEDYIQEAFEWAVKFTNLSGEKREKIKQAIAKQFVAGGKRKAEKVVLELIDGFTWQPGAHIESAKEKAELFVHFVVMKAYALRNQDNQMANTSRRPYWLFDTIDDGRTPPDCAKLDGTIKRWDDPFWKQHPIPCGRAFCRCTITSLSEKQAEQRMRK
jgi:SPP1 gp7 family putative phage head morphogenesis protein